MDWVAVSGSSNIHSVAYDEVERRLHIRFHEGGEGNYEGVPRSVFDALMSADSKGQFVHRHLKDRYRWEAA